MAETNAQPVIQVPEGVPTAATPAPSVGSPTPSETIMVPQAPTAPEKPPKTPRDPRPKGLPAGPAALAGANTVALTGASVANSFGPTAGVLAAAGVALAAVSLGTQKVQSKKSAARRAADRRAAQNRGLAYSPSGRSGSSHKSGKWTGSKSGPTRSGSVNTPGPRASTVRTGLGSGPTRAGSGSGPGRHRAGSGDNRIPAARTGSGSSRVRPEKVRSGSGGQIRPQQHGSKDPGSGSGRRDRPRILRSSPTRTSLARKISGPRPTSGSRSGGLINRSDGSRRQPIRAVRNGTARATDLAKKIGRAGIRAHNSKIGKASRGLALKAGKASRKWTLGAVKRAWGVGWPLLASAFQGVTKILRKQGWRAAWEAMKTTWASKRARWAKNTKADEPATPPAIPAETVNLPTNIVGGNAPATAPRSTGGGISMAQARFIQAAAEMLGAAMVYQPEGMMQVGNDFAQMPEAFRNVANAMKKMADRANDEDPIHPAIIDMMGVVYQHLQSAATAAEELAPAFRQLHAVDIKRIEEPRRGEERWDVANNRSH